MTELVCTSERLSEPCDLLSIYRPDQGFFFEHQGSGVVSWGAAATINVPPGPDQVASAARRSAAVLQTVRQTGAIAPLLVGALPFEGTAGAVLVVPRMAVARRRDGSLWRILVEPAGHAPPPVEEPPIAPRSPSNVRISPIPSPGSYRASVATAVKRIIDGELEKVVLARMLVAQAEQPFDRLALLRILIEREPNAHVFAVNGFLGASPELLVARFGNEVRATAIAGTIGRGDDPQAEDRAAARLLASEKDRAEQRLVMEAVRSRLEGVCVSLHLDPDPGILRLRTVLHLMTRAQGTLATPWPTALELAARLHPTPAVSGTPPREAMRMIRELEPFDRTLYAGMVGWMDASGDGEWAVALRCAEVRGRIALLFAGAGIVADSDPESELAETDAKFQTILDTLCGEPLGHITAAPEAGIQPLTS